METRLIQLSKTLAHALRHEPWQYELELDDEGWVSTEDLHAILQQRSRWHDLTESDFAQVIADPVTRCARDRFALCMGIQRPTAWKRFRRNPRMFFIMEPP